MTKYTTVSSERHEPGMSLSNNLNRWDQIMVVKPATFSMVMFETSKTMMVNIPSKQACDPENGFQVHECMTEFMQHKLGCTFPWHKTGIPAGFKGLPWFYLWLLLFIDNGRVCDKPEDLDGFVTIFKDFAKPEVQEEIGDFGCLRRNCQSYKWSIGTIHEYPLIQTNFYQPNLTVLQYFFQKNRPIKVLRQSLSYGFSNFVADFGGYLGLLLGASMVSIYDTVISFFKKLLNSLS